MGERETARAGFVLRDAAATRLFGAALAQRLWPGAVVALHGRVGAGKTTLVQGIAVGLGIDEPAGSPTFVLATEYSGGRLPLYHIDLYRLDARAAGELDMFDEYLFAAGICVVEWAEFIEAALPAERIAIRLEDAAASLAPTDFFASAGRRALLFAYGSAADDAARKLVWPWPS